MNTKILKIEKDNCMKDPQSAQALQEAGEIMKAGGLVAFPTETVYGLGADGLNAQAAAKIYEAKGRPSNNPLIVHIASMEQLPVVAAEVDARAIQLAEKFWPGPLTMIFRKTDRVPLGTTGGLDTVAVRMPNHPVALALIQQAGGFVAAPSANTSGRPSPTVAAHVYEDLQGKIPLILDGGTVEIGLESTIVDLTESVATVLRPGAITVSMLAEVVGEVQIDPAILVDDPSLRPKAPGMMYRHYAPKAQLTLVAGKEEAVIDKICQLTAEAHEKGGKVGVIATEETAARYQADCVKIIGSREEEASIAVHMYDVLRGFDHEEVDVIYSESFEGSEFGQAIMNRMLKAAGHRVIQVTEPEEAIGDKENEGRM